MMEGSFAPYRLAGRVLVTGAGSGIGAATVRSGAARRADVVATGRQLDDQLTALADEVGATAAALDVSDPAAIARAIWLIRVALIMYGPCRV